MCLHVAGGRVVFKQQQGGEKGCWFISVGLRFTIQLSRLLSTICTLLIINS